MEEKPETYKAEELYQSIKRTLGSDYTVLNKFLELANIGAIVETSDMNDEAKKPYFAILAERFRGAAQEFTNSLNYESKRYNKSLAELVGKDNIVKTEEQEIKPSNTGSYLMELADFYAQKAGLKGENQKIWFFCPTNIYYNRPLLIN